MDVNPRYTDPERSLSKKKKHYPPFEQLSPALNFGLADHKGFFYLQNLHIDQCYVPILLLKAFLHLLRMPNLSCSNNCLSLWGLGGSGKGGYINVRVYLLSIIKFPLIFFSCNC